MSSNSSSRRSRQTKQKAELPIVAGVQVQMIAGRGVRCREPGRGGFVPCPDEVRNDPRYSAGFGTKPKAPKSPAMMIQGFRIQQIKGRGFRCRGQGTGQGSSRFVACPESVKEELVARYGEEAVYGKAKGPASPIAEVRGVRIQFLRGRGWRCRSVEGAFISCPDDIYEELQNRPPPPGMEQTAGRRKQAPRQGAQSPRQQVQVQEEEEEEYQPTTPFTPSRGGQGASNRPADYRTPPRASAGGVRRLGNARR